MCTWTQLGAGGGGSATGIITAQTSTTTSVSAVTFTGSGLDDLTVSGTPTCLGTTNYVVGIESAGSPDTWGWDDEAFLSQTGEPMTTSAFALTCGMSVTFAHSTGHTSGDKWSFSVTASQAQPPLTIKNPAATDALTVNADGSLSGTGDIGSVYNASQATNWFGFGALGNGRLTTNGNTALAPIALYSCKTVYCYSNVATGIGSLQYLDTGDFNVAGGVYSLPNMKFGTANISLSGLGGGQLIGGSYNILEGVYAGQGQYFNNQWVVDTTYTNTLYPFLIADLSTSELKLNAQLTLQTVPAQIALGFNGSGTISSNTIAITGTYTGSDTENFCFLVDGIGTPSSFSWGYNSSCINGATGVTITGAAQTLRDGLSVTFSTATMPVLNEQFFATAYAATPPLIVDESNGSLAFKVGDDGSIQVGAGGHSMSRCSGGASDGSYVASGSTQATACTTGGGTLVSTGIKTP